MIEIDIACNGCRAKLENRDEVHCADCMKAVETCAHDFRAERDELEGRVAELESENTELQKELGESEGQRETEAEVFAAQLREKGVLINALLEKVHAA